MAEPTAPKGAPPPRHFGHGPLAQRLAHEVFDSLLPAGERRSELHPKTTGRLGPALVVGVFGEWGAGKSYLLSEVGDEIKQLREQRSKALVQQHPPGTEAGEPPTEITVLVEFNAWRFEREPHLLIPMLKVAEQAMRDEVERAMPPGTKRREWLADHVALLGALIEGICANGGRQALQMWLDAQGAALKLPEPAKDDKPPKPSILERLGLKKKALAAPRKVSTPIPALESLYFNFFEYLRGITGRNPSFLKNVQQRLTQGGLGPGIEALHRLEQAGRWLTTGQMREPARLHVNLVFLVDDLDRCLPEKAIEVLEAVKLFLDVEGCAFVLALDEEVVERGIAHRYQAYTSAAQGQTPITGAEYLEKLIHLPIRLPRPSASEAQRFLADHWPALYAQQPNQAPPYEPNDLAKLVSVITPPVPRKLQRITSLMQLNKAFSGVMRSDSGPMAEADQRAWLGMICALQLFAPSLFRYLRIHGAGLLTEVVQWRSGLKLNNLSQLKTDLREATVNIKEVAQLRDAYAREVLPDLVGAAMQNRSGFSLITWLAEADRLMGRATPSPTQLGYLLSLTVNPGATDASSMESDESPVEESGDMGTGLLTPSNGGLISEAGRESKFARQTLGSIQYAKLDQYGEFLEALMAKSEEVLRNALAREGANLHGRYLPNELVDQLAQRLVHETDHWLISPDQSTEDPRLSLINPLLTQSQVLRMARALSGLGWMYLLWRLSRPSWGRIMEGRDVDTAWIKVTPPVPGIDAIILQSVVRVSDADWISRRAFRTHARTLEWGNAATAKLGADGEHGLYLDLTIQGITQRLRWIEPGTFLMGSLTGQGGGDENPQHSVTLSQGFWLADTPCTQALWQAVMGDNPSDFKTDQAADQRPVENVSFDDVQAFIARFGKALPTGWLASLPTEAEWEYACRAGTTTAYWWGDLPDDRRANWNDQQKATTPVRQYPANPWGLHDMHGNVWEWCTDRRRVYLSQAECDPVGGTEGNARVVRGGSWITRSGNARSAYRLWWHIGDRRHFFGFRFVLRSPGPGTQPERAAEPA